MSRSSAPKHKERQHGGSANPVFKLRTDVIIPEMEVVI
jgi:hypothetical protein